MEKVHKNNRIYDAGHAIDYVYIVNKGSIKLGMVAECDKILIKDIVYDQEIFGENIFARNIKRKDFSEAMADCKEAFIPGEGEKPLDFMKSIRAFVGDDFCNQALDETSRALGMMYKPEDDADLF